MKLAFGPRGILQIDGARIIFRNFRGEGSQYNREGDRNFAVVIPDRDLTSEEVNNILDTYSDAEMVYNESMECDVLTIAGEEVLTTVDVLKALRWNVKVKKPRTPEESPMHYLEVKVSFNDRGPAIFLSSGNNRRKLTEQTAFLIDEIDILEANMDVRPYDWSVGGREGRSAYLQEMYVVQEIGRFSARFAEEEYPEE